MKIIVKDIDDDTKIDLIVFYGLHLKEGQAITVNEAEYIIKYCLARGIKLELDEATP